MQRSKKRNIDQSSSNEAPRADDDQNEKENQEEKIVSGDDEKNTELESRRMIWKERRALERFRVESLIELKDESRRNELKKKEVELFVNNQSVGRADDDGEELDDDGKQVLQEFELAQQEENIVKLNLRGKIFITTIGTLCKRDSMLRVMLESQFGMDKDANGSILIDRDPEYFPIILEHLRTGSTTHIGIWEEATKRNRKKMKKLLDESDFFATEKLTQKLKLLLDKYKIEIEKNKLKSHEPEIQSSSSVEDTIMDEEFYSKFALLTLEEKERVEKYIKEQKEILSKEFEDLKEMEMSKSLSDITLNVRGIKFTLPKSKLLREPDSLFYTIVKNSKNQEIFVDRDPEVFKIIYEFLVNGKIESFPTQLETKKQVYNEAKHFRLKGLLEYFDICRYPIEEIGEKNMKYKRYEDFLRNLFAVDRENIILNDPYINLINVFGSSNNIRKSFKHKDPILEKEKLLFNFEDPIDAFELAKKSSLVIPYVPDLVDSKEQFLKQFNIFTDGIFESMDWSNIFVAGGAVLASCLKVKRREIGIFNTSKLNNTELWEKQKYLTKFWGEDDGSDGGNSINSDNSDEYVTDEECEMYHSFVPHTPPSEESTIRTCYNEKPWSKSDIDVFLYGLSEVDAEKKIVSIFNTFKKNCKKDILILRTQHAITFKFGGFTKSVQIILRIYKSPAEVLMGFDIPCCSIGFNGFNVFCLPRAREAIRTRCNIVDPDRQSTTFETRLIKYGMRGFRIGVCGYNITKVVNPVLLQGYQQRITQFTGLARILVIINSFKRFNEFDALTYIKGRRTIEKTEQSLKLLTEPSKKHDYSQVDISFRYATASDGFSKIDRRVQYMAKNLKKKPFFEYALNDIQAILRPKTMVSDLSPQIEFIQIDPGQQHVGCFNPTSNNFLQHAYSPFSKKKKSKFHVKVYRDGEVIMELDAKTSAEFVKTKKKQAKSPFRNTTIKIGAKSYVPDFTENVLYENISDNWMVKKKRVGYFEIGKDTK